VAKAHSGLAALTGMLFFVPASFSPANACGGIFDIGCNVGKIIERAAQDTGKTIEKSAQDVGKSIEKSAQDAGKTGEKAVRDHELAQSPTDPCKLNPALPQCKL
jgi:hypothetical protein